MTRAVITGGAGFLGSHLCDRLLQEGFEVVSIDNFITGGRTNLRHLDGEGGLTLLEQDVTKRLEVPGSVDVVLHFASPASPVDYAKYPIQTLKAGALGTHVTLGLAKAKGARYLLASSSEVYGDPTVNPQSEGYWGNVNPIGPRGVYDEAKRYAEAMTMAYHQVHDMNTHIARIFNSVAGTERIVLLNDHELHTESVEDYFESRDPESVMEVPCFDPDSGRVQRLLASDLLRIPFHGDLYTIRTTYGRQVRVTGDHSVFTHDDQMRPVPITVRDLTLGTRVAVPSKIDIPSVEVEVFDLPRVFMETFSEDELWEYVLSDESLAEQVSARRKDVYELACERSGAKERRSSWGSVTRWKRSGRVPLAVVKTLRFTWSPEAEFGAASAPAHTLLPSRIKVTDDLLWLLGFFVAEGTQCRIEKKAYYLSFSSEPRFLRRAEQTIKSLFKVHVGEVFHPNLELKSIYVHSKPLHALFTRVFDLKERHIPSWILQLPLSRVKHFLEGYKDGDGTHSGKYVGKLVAFSTISQALAEDLVYLLLRFGIIASFGHYETTFKRKYGNRKFPFYRVTIMGLSTYNILEWDEGVTQKIQRKRFGDIVWAQVKEIRRNEYQGFVYDLSVPGAENFIAGSGVFCHNTYGPRMRLNDGRAVPNFIHQGMNSQPLTIFGDGTQTRSFCYVSDMIEAIWRLLNSSVHDPINLGNPEEVTILELANRIQRLVGGEGSLVFEDLPQDDPRVRHPDISKAIEELDWRPQVTLDDGLKRTIEYFRGELDG